MDRFRPERIRDKMAASKKKGMWMGGNSPLGYDNKDRQLFLNEKEAEVVNHIFLRFIELKCAYKLFKELKTQNIKGKERTLRTGRKIPPHSFSYSVVRYILTNPVYIGKIRHKNKVYQGHHKPIISGDLWDSVQTLLAGNSKALRKRKKKIQSKNLLHGKIFDESGNPYIPVDTYKGEKQYSYYKSKNHSGKLPNALERLSACEIEGRVEQAIRDRIFNFKVMGSLLNVSSEKVLTSILDRQHAVMASDLLRKVVKKVTVHNGYIAVDAGVIDICNLLLKEDEVAAYGIMSSERIKITAPYISRRAHQKITIIKPGDPDAAQDIYFNMPVTKFKNQVRGML